MACEILIEIAREAPSHLRLKQIVNEARPIAHEAPSHLRLEERNK